MANKFFSKLTAMEGAVKRDYDPLLNCLTFPMPSVSWAFGVPGHGLPYGYTMVLWGPPKGGKSIICNAAIGQLHKDDPEAMAITFNTELRGEIQNNASQLAIWGIDPDRFVTFDVNQPELIFDRIEYDINDMCQQGAKIKLICIDSISAICGRRTLNSKSVNDQQIGDKALTVQTGLERILPILRKHKIALILTAHVRAEMDQKEQMRHKTIKMATAWATKHQAEFFAYVEPNQSKEGRVDLLGDDFINKDLVDFMGKEQKTGHKIRFRVDQSSLGVSGRTAEFTLSYDSGIINQFEEVFRLGVCTGVIQRPNNVTYQYKDKSWKGIASILTAIRDQKELYDEIIKDVFAKDVENYLNKGK